MANFVKLTAVGSTEAVAYNVANIKSVAKVVASKGIETSQVSFEGGATLIVKETRDAIVAAAG
jgi:hypothetical protein